MRRLATDLPCCRGRAIPGEVGAGPARDARQRKTVDRKPGAGDAACERAGGRHERPVRETGIREFKRQRLPMRCRGSATEMSGSKFVRRGPATARIEPASTRMEPASAPMEPASVRMEPASVRMEPATTRTEPATARTEPATVQIEPATARTETAMARIEPATVQTEPATVRIEPATVRIEPASVRMEPASVRTEPASARMEPASMRIEPATAQTGPATARSGATVPAWVASSCRTPVCAADRTIERPAVSLRDEFPWMSICLPLFAIASCDAWRQLAPGVAQEMRRGVTDRIGSSLMESHLGMRRFGTRTLSDAGVAPGQALPGMTWLAEALLSACKTAVERVLRLHLNRCCIGRSVDVRPLPAASFLKGRWPMRTVSRSIRRNKSCVCFG